MTRRDFGARLGRAFFGMVGLVTMLKATGVHGTDSAHGAENVGSFRGRTPHIENRRLWSFVAGAVTLADRERVHLHECNVCQEIADVLMRQSVPFRI